MSDPTPMTDPLLDKLDDIRSGVRKMPDTNDLGYMIMAVIAVVITVVGIIWGFVEMG